MKGRAMSRRMIGAVIGAAVGAGVVYSVDHRHPPAPEIIMPGRGFSDQSDPNDRVADINDAI
jgi:hypothetical protein